MLTCILCFEDEQIYGVGICNHGPICFKCIIKCRTKLESKTCPICKVNILIRLNRKKLLCNMAFRLFNRLPIHLLKFTK